VQGGCEFLRVDASSLRDRRSCLCGDLDESTECIDRIAAARASITKDGAIIENQYGVAKMNPACVLEKAARDGFFAAMRLLDIDMSAGITRDQLPWTG
jgi:hypothetical protein